MLVHLVFWHETHAATIAALLRGEQPVLPAGTFAEINSRAVRANAGEPIARLIERWLAAQRRLEQLVAEAGDRPLAIRSKANAAPWSLAATLARMEAHVRNQERKLRAAVHRSGGPTLPPSTG